MARYCLYMPKPPGTSGEGRRSFEREPAHKTLKRSIEVIDAYFWTSETLTKKKPENREFLRTLRNAQEAARKLRKNLTDAEALPLVQTILDACKTYRKEWESVSGKSGADIDRLKNEILHLKNWVEERTTPIESMAVEEPPEVIAPPENLPVETEDAGLELSQAFVERPSRSADSLEEMALREAKNVYLIREGQYFDAYEVLRKRSAFGGLRRNERIGREAKNMQAYQAYVVARDAYIEKMRLSRGPKEAAALKAELRKRDIQISSGIEQHVMPRFLTERIGTLPEKGRTRMSTTFILALFATGSVAADAVLVASTTPPLQPEHNDGRIWYATGRPYAERTTTNFVEIARQQAEEARRRGPARPYVPTPIGGQPRPLDNQPQVQVADTPENVEATQVTETPDETGLTETSENLPGLSVDDGIGGPTNEETPSEP